VFHTSIDFVCKGCHIEEMNLTKIVVFAFVLTGFVCKSGDTVKQTTSLPKPGTDSTTVPQPNVAPIVENRTALKANATRVVGVLSKIDTVDNLNFRVTIHVDSVFAIGEMPSLADAGQDLSAHPKFIRDLHGLVDITNERNRRLLTLRHKPAGAPFRGIVSMQTAGFWAIMETDSL